MILQIRLAKGLAEAAGVKRRGRCKEIGTLNVQDRNLSIYRENRLGLRGNAYQG